MWLSPVSDTQKFAVRRSSRTKGRVRLARLHRASLFNHGFDFHLSPAVNAPNAEGPRQALLFVDREGPMGYRVAHVFHFLPRRMGSA